MSSWRPRPNLILLIIALTAAAAVAANYFYRQQLRQEPPGSDSDRVQRSIIGEYRPDFVLRDAMGLSHRAGEWDGRVRLINFWATWCQPCVRELPGFVELQKQYAERGVQFIGIALDTPPEVDAFFKRLRLTPNYPNLIGEGEATAVAGAYGNEIGVLPYTVVVDKAGRIAYTQFGELTRDSAEQMILALL